MHSKTRFLIFPCCKDNLIEKYDSAYIGVRALRLDPARQPFFVCPMRFALMTCVCVRGRGGLVQDGVSNVRGGGRGRLGDGVISSRVAPMMHLCTHAPLCTYRLSPSIRRSTTAAAQ